MIRSLSTDLDAFQQIRYRLIQQALIKADHAIGGINHSDCQRFIAVLGCLDCCQDGYYHAQGFPVGKSQQVDLVDIGFSCQVADAFRPIGQDQKDAMTGNAFKRSLIISSELLSIQFRVIVE